MLYTRSSFIKWLTEVKGCEVHPLRDSNTLQIINGVAKGFIWANTKDVIDYEEIYLLCNRIYIDGLPGDNDLIKIE
jgi:hypothetical protein